ncbi:MAG: single-stranded-DNA-specific exonuclease RecJ [Candidatus Puniceispirillum sp.]
MTPDACLGITQSASDARWEHISASLSVHDTDRYTAGLQEHFADMPLPIARILASRGISAREVETFIDPRLRDLLPDPSRFQDMDKAVARIADSVEAGDAIGIFGDYDVDGASAAALFVNVMRALNIETFVHIPDRFKEGYGPNADALNRLQEKGASLLITVDCGISAHAPLAAVADSGMDVIVIDHHLAGPELPRAHSVINPNRLDEDGSYGHLCAAGVCFVVLVGVLRALRQRGFFEDQLAPDLLQQLDLVALATVCDVVPLTGLNRAFVTQGLKIMAKRQNHGLARLADVAGMNSAPNPYALGFLIGPRINAAGRVGVSELGVKLLSCQREDEAIGLAARLDEMNKERRIIEEDIRANAMDRASAQTDNHVLVVGDEAWHEGVIGIVAGRLKDRFAKPACVIAFSSDGLGKGSARSIPGFAIGNAIIAAHQMGLLEGGGGHDMAAGFSIMKDKVDDFQAFMNQRLLDDLKGEIPKVTHKVSALLSVAGCQPEVSDWLDKLGPFGSGNPEPRFVLPDCRIKNIRLVGDAGAHISCRLDDGSGTALNAIAFQAGGAPIGQLLQQAADGRYVHVLGKLRRDRYRGGRAMQIEIEDVATPALAFGRS